jgi:hypothetical protein
MIFTSSFVGEVLAKIVCFSISSSLSNEVNFLWPLFSDYKTVILEIVTFVGSAAEAFEIASSYEERCLFYIRLLYRAAISSSICFMSSWF